MSSQRYIHSPAEGVHLADNFLSNSSVADAAVGDLDWEWAQINSGTVSLVTSEPFGVLRNTTGATGGDGSVFFLHPDSIVLGSTPGFFEARVRYPAITGNVLAGNNFRIGLTDVVTVASTTTGIWVESDAGVLSLECHSGDHGDRTVAAAGGPTLTDGTTMVLGAWHTIRVQWDGANAQGGPKNVHMLVDGTRVAHLKAFELDNDETMEPKILHWQDATDTLEFDIDWYELFLSR